MQQTPFQAADAPRVSQFGIRSSFPRGGALHIATPTLRSAQHAVPGGCPALRETNGEEAAPQRTGEEPIRPASRALLPCALAANPEHALLLPCRPGRNLGDDSRGRVSPGGSSAPTPTRTGIRQDNSLSTGDGVCMGWPMFHCHRIDLDVAGS
ncbi:hypothetical protein CCHR01_04646 [Colletotrichum chrysophilum]|uniref:Uncharacterized protein n=1 Tax=Colletotrichum chrysophilum TaxID=1836956 RepID=A0AAD9ATZ6_9PEZI|nr:hypothetical protein CCHR01_04646 [Colletotrichum chrysophilum]